VITAGRTLLQEVWCENKACKRVIMRVWLYQGRRQNENVSCPCDITPGEALRIVKAQRQGQADASPPSA
jgi:hypothetical protein